MNHDYVIDCVNHQGFGEVRLSHEKYLVPYVLPKEKVRVQPIGKKRGWHTCNLVSVLESSPKRVKPLCPYFGVCGGCQLQHIDYVEQLKLKRAWLVDWLQQDPLFQEVVLNEIMPSKSHYGYRNRITLHSNETEIGFYKNVTHDIIPVSECAIASDLVNDKLKTALDNISSNEETFELREDENSCFVQVNNCQNENLIQSVLRLCEGQTWQQALDLYCGSGNFTRALSAKAKKVLGVDSSEEAIQMAQKKAKEDKNKKTKYLCGDVLDQVFSLAQDYHYFDLILCDPPRGGLGEVLSYLPRLKPQKLIYISCHPQNFFKDAKKLSSLGFSLKEITPVDMFPQTVHLEIIGLFDRR
ncbi:MAG: methyltransferase domain-containing protein [bacterium]